LIFSARPAPVAICFKTRSLQCMASRWWPAKEAIATQASPSSQRAANEF
jgi:hypothetical protein